MPVSIPPLEPKSIDIWQVHLDDNSLDFPVDVLSPDEHARAARLQLVRDRARFQRRRVVLRLLLGQYLGCAPQALQFHYCPGGKPELAEGGDLRFNLSHSNDIALYAVAHGCEIGVDIERILPNFNWQPVARQFFSGREYAFLCGLPRSRQVISFFAVWTQKEAYLKARGQGLTLPLDQFQVPGVSHERYVEGYTITNIAPSAEWVAALAAQGDALSLRC